MIRALAALLLVASTPARSAPAHPAPAAVPHDLHVAHTRMVIEGNAVVARVRMFRDDLEKALKRKITDDAASRAAVSAYVTQHFLVRAEGAELTGEVLDGGGDVDNEQPIWWVLVQWKAPKPVKTLGVRVHLMFETFNDQQNTVLVAKQPGDERRGLYFQAGDRAEQVLTF
ncbi:MAG: hypothetical protein HYV19_06110 [Gemmatimonadetes bacterium]|nr:hypothetical protein [Gemmatimonadota bacterium]